MHSVKKGRCADNRRSVHSLHAHIFELALLRCIPPCVLGGRTLMQVGASAMATLCTLPTTLRTYCRATAATASSEWGSYANWNAMLSTDFQHWVESSPLRNGSIAWESRLF